tara:strand:- start:378 stop:677 length:300 start_codon:yes stop_codon:yes gene_type:complete
MYIYREAPHQVALLLQQPLLSLMALRIRGQAVEVVATTTALLEDQAYLALVAVVASVVPQVLEAHQPMRGMVVAMGMLLLRGEVAGLGQELAELDKLET